MAENSKIAWTTHTANYWIGCAKVSPGCAHCYAETLVVNRMGLDVWGPWPARRRPVKTVWAAVDRWNREARGVLDADRPRVFVMSLGDFAEDHPDAEAIRPRAWEQIRRSHWLDFLILTKRPDRYPAILPPDWGDGYHNVWLGTSIENDRFTGRADALRAVPAAVWFLSLEPLLGPLPSLDLAGIDWIIVGGESGAGFRPMEPAWALDVLARAAAAGVARFYKQGAAFYPQADETIAGRVIHESPVRRGAHR